MLGLVAAMLMAMTVGAWAAAPDAAATERLLRRVATVDDPAALRRLQLWSLLGHPASVLAYAQWQLHRGDAFDQASARSMLRTRMERGDVQAAMLLIDDDARSAPPTRTTRERQALQDALELGARHDVPAALLRMGQSASRGEFAVASDTKALRYWLRAADLGSAQAMFLVANAYRYGTGTRIDAASALTWYERAAQAEHPAALHELALAYTYGELGLPRDPSMATLLDREAGERHRH